MPRRRRRHHGHNPRYVIALGAVLVAVLALFVAWQYGHRKVTQVLEGRYDRAKTCDGDFWVRRAEAYESKFADVQVVEADGRQRSVRVAWFRVEACLALTDGADYRARAEAQFQKAVAAGRTEASSRFATALDDYLADRYDTTGAILGKLADLVNGVVKAMKDCKAAWTAADGIPTKAWDCLIAIVRAMLGESGNTERRAEARRLEALLASVGQPEKPIDDFLGDGHVKEWQQHQQRMVARILRRPTVDRVRLDGSVANLHAAKGVAPVVGPMPGTAQPGLGTWLLGQVVKLGGGTAMDPFLSNVLATFLVIKFDEWQNRDQVKTAFWRHFDERMAAWERKQVDIYRQQLVNLHKTTVDQIKAAAAGGRLVVMLPVLAAAADRRSRN